MNKTGFIGYGHMGGALLKSLLASGAVDAKDVVVTTRTKTKLDGLKREYPNITVAEGSRDIAAQCKRLFICTGTFKVAGVVKEILDLTDEATHLILISGGIEMKSVETVFKGKITRIIPTLLCEVNEGFTLLCCNGKVDAAEKEWLESALGKVGRVKEVGEEMLEAGAVLTSCAPGLIACILDRYSQAAEKYGFTRAEAYELLLNTSLGTAELLEKTGESFDQLVGRVATKGGSTELGARVLEEQLPAVLGAMFEHALSTYPARKERTGKQFRDSKT